MRSAGMRARVSVCIGLLVLTASACSSANDEQNGPMPACLASAGHDGSLENVDKHRIEDPAFNKAFEQCAKELDVKILPAGEETRLGDEMVLEQFRCMKDAGWDVPEPKRALGGLVLDGMESNVPKDLLDEFDADYRTCTGRSRLHPSPGHEGHQHGH